MALANLNQTDSRRIEKLALVLHPNATIRLRAYREDVVARDLPNDNMGNAHEIHVLLQSSVVTCARGTAAVMASRSGVFRSKDRRGLGRHLVIHLATFPEN
jgi:hypothetical protein